VKRVGRVLQTVPVQWLILIALEAVARQAALGSSLVASLLSATTSGFRWELIMAVGLVVLRGVTVYLGPALLVVWILGRVWPDRPNRSVR
jgi:hypothetical protein